MDGLVHEVSEGGNLFVIAAGSGGLVCHKVLADLNPRLTWVCVVGVCTGPTLAGT